MPLIRTNPPALITDSTTDFFEEMASRFDSFVTCHYEGDIATKTSGVSVYTRPELPSELMVKDPDLLFTLDNTANGQGYMQVFRASADNINTIQLSMRGEGSQEVPVENFDGYADTNALDQVWASTTGQTNLNLVTTPAHTSPNSMEIVVKNPQSLGGLIYRDYAPSENWASFTALETYWYFNSACEWQAVIIDSNLNEATFNFTDGGIIGAWQMIDINLQDFDNASAVDFSDITRFGFRTIATQTVSHYIDSIALEGDVGISLQTEVGLYHFGQNATPASLSDGTQVTFDSGIQHAHVGVKGYQAVRKVYDARVGVVDRSKSIVIGDYYGIWLKPPTNNIYIHHYGQDWTAEPTKRDYSSGLLYAVDNAGNFTSQTKTVGFIVNYWGEAQVQEVEIYGGGGKYIAGYIYMITYDSTTGEDLHYHGQREFSNSQQLIRIIPPQDTAFDRIHGPDTQYCEFFYQGHPRNTTDEVEIDITWKHNEITRYG